MEHAQLMKNSQSCGCGEFPGPIDHEGNFVCLTLEGVDRSQFCGSSGMAPSHFRLPLLFLFVFVVLWGLILFWLKPPHPTPSAPRTP